MRSDRDDELSRHVSAAHLAKGLTYLVEGIGLLDHRPDGAALDQLPERVHVGTVEARDEELRLSAPGDRGELHGADVAERPDERRAHRPADHDEPRVLLQHALARAERLAAGDVDEDVVLLALSREVVLRVVDDPVGAEGLRLTDVPRAADRS